MTNRVAPLGLLLLVLVAFACGGPNPSTPNPLPSSSPRSGPAPTPVPVPTATPTPAAIHCGAPLPPPLYTFRLKVHLDQGFKKVLDSRVMVRDAAYCASIGQPGDICVIRNELAADAVTCGNKAAGVASQTGRYGPNWYWNDQPCRGIQEGGDAPGCKQHPSNQFFVFSFGPGVYSACGDGDRVCHGIDIK